MNPAPTPVVFEPLYKIKPWGGRMLATLFNKPLPADEQIGESWELVSLPGNESRVARGPLAGRTISDLLDMWGTTLIGNVDLVDGRFPLLIKFLDARENLSVQVHPKPDPSDSTGIVPGIKHEAWYVLHADPDACMFIGLKKGVTHADLATAANTPQAAQLLQAFPVQAGDCFYLPSGVIHALGAGLVVAEIQTPSDVTYRLYDWDRLGTDGQPRELHIQPALANVRLDIADSAIAQPRHPVDTGLPNAVRITTCERFLIDRVHLQSGILNEVRNRSMAIWIILRGRVKLNRPESEYTFQAGEVVLIPADHQGTTVQAAEECELLEVTIPQPG
ncbi:MAG: type I phosphomannose isomerase catalytic subunit [Planctomycetota bacterium]